MTEQDSAKAKNGTNAAEITVSVLVPIYNTEAYLRQALDSLRAQTLSNFEVVCINDGSTDSSRQIIQEYLDADARFRVIDKPNSGYGASMNRGLVEATGKYIAILEPDDFFEPNALELLVGAAEENNAEVAKANYWFYWSSPEPRYQLISVVKPHMANHLFSPQVETDVYLTMPSIWSAVYRRSFLQQNGIDFLETPGASFQDLGFTFKVWAHATRVFMLEQPILHYRQDNEASSVNNPDKAFCVCTELEEIKRVAAMLPNAAQLKPVLYRFEYDNYLWNFQRLAPALRHEFLPYMVEKLREGKEAGAYDPAWFGSWQQKNLQLVLENPSKFEKIYPSKPTKLAKAWYYLRLAGPKALLDIANRKK